MTKIGMDVHSEFNYDNIFDKLDTDESGYIDKSEMEKFIKTSMN